MSGSTPKGRLLSDKLKPWHVILLILLITGLLCGQWWLNRHAAPDEHADAIERRNISSDSKKGQP